jgi:hypothetical protein
MHVQRNLLKIVIGILSILLMLGGYYGWRYYTNHSEIALMQRANAYWEAIRVNDLQTAYQLEAETAVGNLLPHDVEVKPEWGLRVVQFRLGKIEIDGDMAEIDVTTILTMLEFNGNVFPGGTKKDVWTFVDGQWFHGMSSIGGAGIRRKPEVFKSGK